MNACEATEIQGAGSKFTGKSTTLYDLLDDLNKKMFDPEWEHLHYHGKKPLEDGQYDLAAEKVVKMFEDGRIRFKNPEKVQRYFLELLM
jgi:hypothetical protein